MLLSNGYGVKDKLFLIMMQEQKELLLNDLCARLPHKTEIQVNDWTILTTTLKVGHISRLLNEDLEIKPYLFPLTSMTDEQKEELFFKHIHNDIYFDDFTDYFLAGELWHDICVSIDALPGLIDWLNKNHFDYRGLIPKGLAIDATGKNIY